MPQHRQQRLVQLDGDNAPGARGKLYAERAKPRADLKHRALRRNTAAINYPLQHGIIGKKVLTKRLIGNMAELFKQRFYRFG
ncbi:hypothetical protein SDC9_147245 [bioreactor metagenome]|uniref:Uncharacterized protein n=1 Tax=bioreactor metagenome TaxID=1076179 RepID=A0A645EDT5_9ZZZZ